MKNAIIYIGLIGASVTVSYLAGSLLAKLDDSNNGEISEQIGTHPQYGGGSSNSTFDFLIPQSHGYSIGEPSNSGQSSNRVSHYNSHSGGSRGGSFRIFDEKKVTYNNGGGYSGGGYSTTKVKSSSNNTKQTGDELGGNGIPFGNFGGWAGSAAKSLDGAISMSSSSSNQNSTSRIINSTGGFGSDGGFGQEEFETQDGAPIVTPTPIPLDSGSMVLIILGLLTGGYFIAKNNLGLNLKSSKES